MNSISFTSYSNRLKTINTSNLTNDKGVSKSVSKSIDFTSNKMIDQISALNKLSFLGAKQVYDWNTPNENWWPQIMKVVNSKASDKPIIFKPVGKPILQPTDKKADWQNVAVYNPGAIYDKLPGEDEAKFHILYRASDCCYPDQPSLSRWGFATSSDGVKIDSFSDMPLEFPKKGYEVYGIEDPRITKIDDTYFIAYCAYSEKGPRLGLMTTKDFKPKYSIDQYGIDGLRDRNVIKTDAEQLKLEAMLDKRFHTVDDVKKALDGAGLSHVKDHIEQVLLSGFERNELIGPNQEDKDVVFFPKKINGKYAMMHRLGKGIQIAYFDKVSDLNRDYWKNYLADFQQDKDKYTVMEAKFNWEEKLGSGPPPIETDDGWLFIYHTSKVDKNSGKRVYTGGIALLDKEDPTKVLNRVPHPTFVPLNRYEKQLSICPDKDVVFPTAICEKGDDLYVYSGAGDKFVEVYKMDKQALLDYTKSFDSDGNKVK